MKAKLSLPMAPIPLAAGLACLGLMIAASWWGWGVLEESREAAQALFDQKADPVLGAILNQPGGPAAQQKSLDELAKLIAELREEETKILTPWREGTQKAEGAGQAWSQDPGRWKDRLIQVTSELFKFSRETEEGSRVELPDAFYLGLEEFRQKSPKVEELPLVVLHLNVAERLVRLLMETKQEVREGYPTRCQLISLAGPASAPDNVPREETVVVPGARPPTKAAVYRRSSFQMEFDASPEVLYALVDKLSRDEWLLIPKALRIENEKVSFPPRGEFQKLFEPEKSSGEGNASAAPQLLAVLAGKERLRVNLAVDFVSWPSAIAGAPPAPKVPAP